SWRTELLDRTWQKLREHEVETGQPYYQVLRYRSDNPRENSEQMAAALSAQMDPPRDFTAVAFRKTLQRARETYAKLLIEEVAASLGTDSPHEIEEELAALQLLPFCQPFIQKQSNSERR
ncbi:MAG: hypothetical protein KY475_22600, partial [Planctomycetes bacterium]|nr:hypothetical protein [Planctomycetota bacterium]